MARYFKFKNASDLQQKARELGAEIPWSEDVAPLFEPLSVAHRKLGNRLGIQPMEGCDGTLDGKPDELTFRRYHRFGGGGAKLVWGEATAVADEGRMNPRQLWLHDGSASEIERMLTECRDAHRAACGTDSDFLLGLQLTHSGRYSFRKPIIATRDPLLDPRTIDKSTGKPIDESFPTLTDSELDRISDQYFDAVKLAVAVGCDFVDIKQCHRYLLSELLAAKNRPGKYGGSLENRTRFVRELIARVRSEFPQLLIFTRINCFDGIPFREGADRVGVPDTAETPLVSCFGTDEYDPFREDLREPLEVVRRLKQWGVSLFNVSMGNPYANPHYGRPAETPPVDGYLPPEHPLLGVLRHFRIAGRIQQELAETPVMGTAFSYLQQFAGGVAAGAIAERRMAIAGFGRAALSHPQFARSLKDTGAFDRKLVCRTFSYCTNLMRTKDHPLGQYPTGCPPFDKEVYGPLWDEAKEK